MIIVYLQEVGRLFCFRVCQGNSAGSRGLVSLRLEEQGTVRHRGILRVRSIRQLELGDGAAPNRSILPILPCLDLLLHDQDRRPLDHHLAPKDAARRPRVDQRHCLDRGLAGCGRAGRTRLRVHSYRCPVNSFTSRTGICNESNEISY